MIDSYKILWTLRNFLSLSSISTNQDTGQFLLKWFIKKYNVNNLCIFVWGFTMLDPSCWSCLRPRSQPTLGQKAAAETAVQSPPCGWKTATLNLLQCPRYTTLVTCIEKSSRWDWTLALLVEVMQTGMQSDVMFLRAGFSNLVCACVFAVYSLVLRFVRKETHDSFDFVAARLILFN